MFKRKNKEKVTPINKHIHIHTYIHTYIRTYIYTYIYTYIHIQHIKSDKKENDTGYIKINNTFKLRRMKNNDSIRRKTMFENLKNSHTI